MTTEPAEDNTGSFLDKQTSISPQTGSIKFAADSANPEDDDLVFESVSAAARDWLTEILEESLPWVVDATRRVAEKHYPEAISAQREGVLANYLASYGVTGVNDPTDSPGVYAHAAAELLTHTAKIPAKEWEKQFKDSSRVTQSPIETLVKFSHPREEGDRPAVIRDGPASIVTLCDHPTRIWLNLDSDSWANTARTTRENTLNAISALAHGFDILLVASPATKEDLETKHDEWCNNHLTQSNNTPRTAPPQAGAANQPNDNHAQLTDVLQELTNSGHIPLIDVLPSGEGEFMTVQELKDSPDVDLAQSTVDSYYRELEELGIVAVTEPKGSNHVSLTQTGRVAKNRLGNDGTFRHPLQQEITESPTPPQSHASVVCEGGGSFVEYSQSQCFEKALTANSGILGQHKQHRTAPGVLRQHKQLRTAPEQLPLDDCTLSKSEQFARLSAAHQADGLTLVDTRISEFEEGRVAHLGEFEGEVHLITQWGGVLPIMVRVAATLLSQSAFSNILTKDRLTPVLDKPVSEDVLRLGRQIGWIEKTEYSHLEKTLSDKAQSLFQRINGAKNDQDVWASVASDAHGLLASATALYDAVDLDVCIQIRVPDTAELQREDHRYQSLIEFFSHTMPKQALYSGNSAQRLLIETDGDKLKYRLPTEIDPDDNQAELTASWALVGPNVGDFVEDIVSELESIPIREQVANGSETGIEIPIEVCRTDSPEIVRDTIDSMLDFCGRELASNTDTATVTKICCYGLSSPRDERYPSPFDIAEVLLNADHLVLEGAPLGVKDICQGIGWLDDERVYPWLPSSASKMSAALLRADDSQQRKEILEEAEISNSSYERYRGDLDDLGFLVDTGNYQYQSVVPGQHTMTEDLKLSSLSKSHVDQYVELSDWLEKTVFPLGGSPLTKTVTIG